MDITDIHQIFLTCGIVSTDTRKITDGCLFVAIKGEKFDANTFASEALIKGASFCLIDDPKYFIDSRTILVENSLTSLQQLATFHRRYLKVPIIALTGSNGKTTTKELINSVLSQKYNCTATFGNLNNHIGVPLTLLSFNRSTEIGIVEMGANHQKEIEFLCSLALPDYGYVTNFGKAHLEGFGGVEGVVKGKSELYQYLLANNKTAFINLNDAVQVKNGSGIKSFTFGTQDADLKINKISAGPFVNVEYNSTEISSKLIGLYNADNISAAIAIGKFFEVADPQIKLAIESYIPENNRSQLIRKESNEIILDAYNANPSSMSAAIQNFQQLDKKRKLAILGDMFELGTESPAEHSQIVSLAERDSEMQYIFVGPDFYSNIRIGANLLFLKTFDQLADYLEKNPKTDQTILIKGSRGMALERIMDLV